MKLGIYGDRTPPLGQLERDVLEQLWRRAGQSAQDIQQGLAMRRKTTLSAIQTTLERLTRKNLLLRDKNGRSYIYKAKVSREGLLAHMVSDLMRTLSCTDPGLSISGLIELDQNVDGATLDRLELWIESQRKRAKEA
jgi:predicted transcriptional regulator